MNKRLVASAVGAALDPGQRQAEVQVLGEVLGFKLEQDVVKTTVDLKVEVAAVAGLNVGHLVVNALQEFIAAMPTASEGKFETKAGLDVSWRVVSERVG